MSRVSVSRSGGLGNSNLAGSNLDLVGLNPGGVKPITLKLLLLTLLACHSALLEKVNDWLAQCQDNETELDSRS